ncbi:ATP-binding protein [Streptomyces sp. NPDC029674]|uniref:ATP-binding protein n=1 Tax=Streptomyces sp. NPDC029674 TaxID=3365297 RepID=UPI00384EFC75
MSVPETPDTARTTCSEARAAVRSALRPVCRAMPPAQARRVQGDALLVVSELTANAIRHGGGLTHLDVQVQNGVLLLGVSDRSETVPCHVPADPARPGGFGWSMVHRLSASVTVEVERGGKTITAAMNVSPDAGSDAGNEAGSNKFESQHA